jgi:hypothetical protein
MIVCKSILLRKLISFERFAYNKLFISRQIDELLLQHILNAYFGIVLLFMRI